MGEERDIPDPVSYAALPSSRGHPRLKRRRPSDPGKTREDTTENHHDDLHGDEMREREREVCTRIRLVQVCVVLCARMCTCCVYVHKLCVHMCVQTCSFCACTTCTRVVHVRVLPAHHFVDEVHVAVVLHQDPAGLLLAPVSRCVERGPAIVVLNVYIIARLDQEPVVVERGGENKHK